MEDGMYSDTGSSSISPMPSQHHLGSYNPGGTFSNNSNPGGTFSNSGSSSRNSPFELSGNQRMQQPISPQQLRAQGQSSPISPVDAAFQYYGSNSGFSSGGNLNNINQGNLGGSYLSNNSLHNSQDIYGANTQHDSNFSGSLSSNISRSNSQNGMQQSGGMDHQGSRGGSSFSPHPQEWQSMRTMGSHDSQGDPFMQNPYNNNNNSGDTYAGHNSNNMMIIGMNQQQGMAGRGGPNRFAGSQLSQMGSGQSGKSHSFSVK